MNKYRFLSISFMLLFTILVFSGFADKSLYNMDVTLWMLIFAALSELKLHFIKRPDLASKKKAAFISTIGLGISVSILGIIVTNWPAANSANANAVARIVGIIFELAVVLVIILKLVLSWRKLTINFVIVSFIAIVVFLVSAIMSWYGPIWK